MCQQIRAVVEQTNKKCREKLQDSPHEKRVCDADGGHKADGLPHLFVRALAVAETDDRRGAVGKTLHRHGADIPNRI